jgi:DNA-3-methyladenine glycosylase II
VFASPYEAAIWGLLAQRVPRALPHDAAAAELQRLPGIGPWTAEHVLLRRTGATDGLPTAEPRVAEASRQALGRSAVPSAADIGRIAAQWTP